MSRRLLRFCLVLPGACLCLAGCLELVRRPAADPGPARGRAGALTADRLDTAASARPPGAPGRRRDAKAVNEYVYWCIERDLWNEARLHLEKALQHDSLSASLRNNLGIVYERLGDTEQATAAYRTARSLNPRNRAYSRNLELLEQRQKAESGEPPASRPDTTIARLLVPAAEADSAGMAPQQESRCTE